MCLDIEVGFNQYEVLQVFDEPEGEKGEDVLELEVVV